MNKKDVQSITVEYGGFFGGEEKRVLKHDGDKIVVERFFYNGAADDGLLLYQATSWSELLKSIFGLIENWKEEYNDPDVLDGTQWSLDIDCADGVEKHYWGSNLFPDNFDDFLKVIEMER
ncbi:hypothetical protein [Butyrivibrio sp. AE3006]|uniref:hypothetical protein n=1 Tax=Butyrivibrio sp. AE3006 TaxID=1280673 RepID=UPI0003F84830|nr:hypothetical protein [Butyrivibrio sp. AE3006]